MATATTVATPQEQAREIDGRITQLKDAIIEAEAEWALLAAKQRRASEKELGAILRQKEIVGASIERDRALLNEETDRSAALWKTIRDGEAEARRAAALADPERLRAQTLRAIADYRAGLAALNPKAIIIANGLQGLRQIMDGAGFNVFPYPPEAMAAQTAMREVQEALRALREPFDALLK
jgi:hypothetical protein